jgi:hypothetical protein
MSEGDAADARRKRSVRNPRRDAKHREVPLRPTGGTFHDDYHDHDQYHDHHHAAHHDEHDHDD